MTELGLDIHEEILVRSQVNDIIKCKSVCKSWYSLISSPRFVKSHLKYNSKTKYTNQIGDTRITLPDDCVYMRTDAYQLIGSSNGLVCICLYHTYFYVVNPSTREVKELKASPHVYQNSWSERVSGFGYDSSIDDYKVVIGFEDSKKLVFEVLTLKSNVWRSVAVESGYNNLNGNGILCNGAIHWISSDQNDKQVIVSFDLSKEIFKEIPQPNLVLCQWKLGTVKDCLCIFRRPDIEFWKQHFTKFEIWVMRNYNVQESWEQYLPPPGYDAHKKTIEYTTHRNFFYGHVDIWLLEEGSPAPVLVRSIERPGEYAHIQLSTNSECNYHYDEHVFVKSLVSPHGTYDGDGDGNNNDSGNGGRLKRKRKDF